MVVHTTLPVGHPDRPRSLFDDVPLFCGRAKTYDTQVTAFPDRVTCKRCKRLNDRYTEDLDYTRTQSRLATLRSIESNTTMTTIRAIVLSLATFATVACDVDDFTIPAATEACSTSAGSTGDMGSTGEPESGESGDASTSDAQSTGDACERLSCDPNAPECPDGSTCIPLPAGAACMEVCGSLSNLPECAVVVADTVAFCPPA